jgi:hypothetical protein
MVEHDYQLAGLGLRPRKAGIGACFSMGRGRVPPCRAGRSALPPNEIDWPRAPALLANYFQ